MRELSFNEQSHVAGGSPTVMWIDGKPTNVTVLSGTTITGQLPTGASLVAQGTDFTVVNYGSGNVTAYCSADLGSGGSAVRQEHINEVLTLGQEIGLAKWGEDVLGYVADTLNWSSLSNGIITDTSLAGCNSYEYWSSGDQTGSATGYFSLVPWQDVHWGLFAAPGQSWTQVLDEMNAYINNGGNPFAQGGAGGGTGAGSSGSGTGSGGSTRTP